MFHNQSDYFSIFTIFASQSTNLYSIEISLFTVLIFSPFLSFSQIEDLHIDVYQDGKLISATSDTIQLQKKPFEFRIAIEDSSGLVLNTSTDSASYQLALNGASEDEIPSLSPIEGMSDYNDNKNRSLFVKSTGNNYWGLLMSRSSCDFDQIITSEGSMVGIRTIERISFIDDTLRATHEVNSISVEKLYCVYYAYYRDKNHKSVVLPVKHFILTFSED